MPNKQLLALTGGGASLPMTKDFVHKEWPLAGRTIRFKAATAVPNASEAFDADFQREYPQLAVAIGGALPVLDERCNIKEFAGAANQRPQLDRFPITGV